MILGGIFLINLPRGLFRTTQSRDAVSLSRVTESRTIEYRAAAPDDIAAMRTLIFEHGPNQWNYLPEDDVTRHLKEIREARAWAVVAVSSGRIVGFASFTIGKKFPQYESPETMDREHGYIAEVVVHRDYAGSGVGMRLVEDTKVLLKRLGITTVYADRHEENRGSAAVMRKAGFEIVDTFPEPHRRPHGSGRTSVGRCQIG